MSRVWTSVPLRSGKWKLHLPHPYRHLAEAGNDGKPGRDVTERTELALYDLDNDPRESKNVAEQHPTIVKQLMTYVERARADLGDSLTQREAKNARPAGKL